MVSESEFIAFAAETLGVPAGQLALETSYGEISAWDSMAHLRLVMAVAAHYGVEIPFAEVTNVRSLWEFYRRVNGLSPKKAVAVDLDNTLWDGVIGEDGVGNIRPNAALAHELRDLRARGVLLVILSKNDETDALAGLERVEGLTRDDFVSWRIDWNEKADNLRDVARELNLGADAFVFVDDNPAERLKMKTLLPDVTVAAFPPKLAAYFPERELTDEDRHKTEEYRAEARRKAHLDGLGGAERLGDLDVWNALGCRVDVHELRADEVTRVAQLSQKANQFDVCTNRYSEEDVRRLAHEGLVVTCHAGDRFGEQGLVAFVVVRGAEIVDWVMSCRVMGRGIEDRVEAEVERLLRARGVGEVRATWRRSGKNEPVRGLFERFGFRVVESTETEKRYARVLG